MANVRNVPDWEQRVLEELLGLHPEKGRLFVRVYKVAFWHFEGDFSATLVTRYLVRRGYEWADVHRKTMGNWLDICIAVRNKHKPADER